MLIINLIMTMLMNKRLVLTWVLTMLTFGAWAQNSAALATAVKNLSAEETMKHASISVAVYNMDKKTSIYSYNSQRSMPPASLAKLFTTAVGFSKLGSEFRFTTRLVYAGEIDKNGTLHGDIIIIGGGDPLLGSYRYKQTVPDSLFATWQRAVAAAGIRAIEGSVLYDASVFDSHTLHDTWPWGDIGNYYGAGASGLNFHENLFFIYFRPGAKVGAPASVSRTEPAGITHHLVNEVTTAAAKTGDKVVVYGDPTSTLRTCSGTMPIDAKNFSVRASMPKPAQTCADLFTLYLRKHGISVSRAASECFKMPDKTVSLLDYTSPTYYVIAQYTNMTSNNIYAEAIYKYLGYKSYGLGSYDNGAKVVNEFLRSHNLQSQGVRLVDGCGLSPANRVTTDFLCRFLMECSNCRFYNDFYKSLPLAGENGTVKNMLTGLPSNVSVRMKSGSIEGVRAFAGYVTTAKGEHLAFAVICSDYTCTGAQMRAKLEKIILKVATLE